MDSKTKKAVDRLAADCRDVEFALDLALEDDASPESIEQARRLSAELMTEYGNLLGGLAEDVRGEVTRGIGVKVGKIQDRLAKLR